METQTLKEFLAANIDREMLFATVDALGDKMNAPKDRFDKSDIFEQAIEEFSNEKIKWINKTGADHLIPELGNLTMEMKFSANCIYSGKGKKRKAVSIKLMNTQGENKYNSLPIDYAKFVLLMDRKAVMVIETEKIKPYLTYPNDGILAKSVPTNLFLEVFGPSDNIPRENTCNYDYKTEKLKFQRAFLRLIKDGVEKQREVRKTVNTPNEQLQLQGI